ncbi:undecaprenyldiphospho-muramoylpentapeptide beta-N-acetylglucosaminyltransferase [Wenzhouxiangella marina]|uniref:UDP-N-acetylglucosamine--N-acetylmuramyl-(pentapeptide) pyrophosphoryl-undecaprenol N-acetylglucosamine transferase n=1 Tax=Wenzhouxiangella marina TaxID=1579979 RepID=A0A0K0XYM7_9GAMM|nr:undecaprenyldiphospho-muramoylpentapeptide beta-N-acetylglucosaminyltransferase [Wenzhouxiangella marina]AKS42727.1 UDP-N-acetylglucosamine--N-acetylmuramyl-(pentapeptide) pyrophosphoryl-undecaprenol N-acetylglucosamine transferase [Wenzhouxiangella marina]MBB6088583.1 UDP-N-acetylglucosamine--N-acetylmuramyl-(pentapeptide) pyrophosphoryl-undecaprenol N-acetylglucosamine transferase [Wenzhouxiangella marina]
MSRARVLIMAGGTGGHIFPGLSVARELRAEGVEVRWLGTPNGLENRLVPAAGIELDTIDIAGLRGRGLLGWLVAPFRVLKAMVQARRILRRHRPDCVLSMGGYVAGPGGVMARLMGIPLVLHEQNAIAGLTNRWLRPLAARVMSGFPAVLKGAEHCGNPVRDDIAALPDPEARFADRSGPLQLLVIGGSQGALAFAEVIPQALARLPAEARPRIVHQAGRQYQRTLEAYRAAGVEGEVVEFIDDMAEAWGRADLAICRAGALTVAELAAAGVAALLVPFPAAVDDHQTANAEYLTAAHAAWLLPQREFTPERLAERLASLSRKQLAAMAGRARALARPRAGRAVADVCLEVAR